jgi:hypothetical protein
MILIAALLSLAGLVISTDAIMKHLYNYTCPKYQLHICRILMMVPLYTLTSFMSLLQPDLSLVFGLIRDRLGASLFFFFGGENFIVLLNANPFPISLTPLAMKPMFSIPSFRS